MGVKAKYTANSSNDRTANIRNFVCRVQNGSACADDENPLPTFNALLDWVVEQAFAEGVEFGRKYEGIEVELNHKPDIPQ